MSARSMNRTARGMTTIGVARFARTKRYQARLYNRASVVNATAFSFICILSDAYTFIRDDWLSLGRSTGSWVNHERFRLKGVVSCMGI